MSRPQWRPETLALHGSLQNPCRVAYSLGSLKRGEGIFNGTVEGHAYSRVGSEPVQMLEELVANMSGAEAAICTQWGMSAILLLVVHLTRGTCKHIVATKNVYGGVYHLLTEVARPWGVEVTFVKDPYDPASWQEAIRTDTVLVLVESPTNPCVKIFDIRAIVEAMGVVPVAVDNTLVTWVLQKPLALGATYQFESMTKGPGEGNISGGFVAGSKQDITEMRTLYRTMGLAMIPQAAFLIYHHIKTLALRVRAQSERAEQFAQFLHKHPSVARVHYPTIGERAETNKKLMPQFGCVVAAELKGGREAVLRAFDAFELFTNQANFWDVISLVCYPFGTTHHQMSPEDLAESGITPALIRFSIGLEDLADLMEDFDRAVT